MLPPDRWFITGLVVIEACHPAGVPLLGGGGALVNNGLWEGQPDWLAERAGMLSNAGVQKTYSHKTRFIPLLSRSLLPPPPRCHGSWGRGYLSAGRSCVLRVCPVCPAATSTDSQHQLIIATAAVKEPHFSSDRLMTCKTRWY